MKNIMAILCLVLAGIMTMQCTSSKTFDLAIQNIKLFDSKNKKVITGKTILINADTIAAIVDASQQIDAKEVVTGKGRLLVPGFIDTHIHLRQMLDIGDSGTPQSLDDSYRKKLTEKLLEYGTTTAFDMGQPEPWMNTTIQWQKNPASDYPNYYIVGSAMISDLAWNNPAQHHVVIANPAKGVEKVQQYSNLGLKHIKLYSKLEKDDMEAIVGEAKKQKIHMYAHTDYNIVTMSEAMELGVFHFEHFFTLIPSVLEQEAHWDSMRKKFGISRIDHIDDFSTSMVFFFQYIKENPEIENNLMALFDKLAQEKATLSTALHVLGAATEITHFFSSFNHFPIRNSPELPDYSAEQKQRLKEAFNTMMRYVKMAHDRGVKLRIGTDNREAGQAMLSEFLLLHKAGFSVEEILQIATWNGATAMQVEDKYGSIEVGKKADLVLFEKNPFDNYMNFLSSKTVIKGGKGFTPTAKGIPAVLSAIEEKGIASGMNIIENKTYPLEAYELVEIGYHLLQTGKIKEGMTVLDFAKERFPTFENIYFEGTINEAGYRLLYQKKLDEAIEAFKYNVRLFPESSNVYDSLGEAYMNNGDTELAIKNYEKSVELNPQNTNGITILKRLKNKR